MNLPLSNGKTAFVDDDIYDMFKDRKWHPNTGGYPSCNSVFGKERRTETLHQLIMGTPPKGCVIDHINCNPLDNRRVNLRFVNRKVNNLNSKNRKWLMKHQGAWRVRFVLKDMKIDVSGIKTEEAAQGIASLLKASLIYHEMTQGGSSGV